MPVVVSLVAAATTGATLLVDRQYHAFRRRVGVTQLETEIAALSKQLASLDSQKRSLDDRCMAIMGRVRSSETDVANHATQIANAARHWDEKTAAVHYARDLALQEVARKENDRLVQTQTEFRTRIAAITQQLSFLDMHRDARLGSRLHELQMSFIDTALKDHELRDVRFEGLGETLLARLKAAGFQTAFDILANNPRTVSGIGTARAYALEAWARDIRARAEKAAPKQLPAHLKKEVVADFAQQKRRLEDDIVSLERQLAQLTQASHQALAAEQQGLRQRFRLEEDKVGRERYEWEQSARKRGQELEACLQQHRSECMRVTEQLASERERLHLEENAIGARRSDRLKHHETFRGLSFFSFLMAVARMA
jgi:cell division septum initiation protein DivIVA